MIKIGALPKELAVSPESVGVPVARLDDEVETSLPRPRDPDPAERDPYTFPPIPELYLG